MAEILCRSCRANPIAVGARCSPCHVDHLAAQRAEQNAQERERIESRRRGRPAWKPDHGDRGHGMGRGRHCDPYGRSGV
jgi:hypothetical protein